MSLSYYIETGWEQHLAADGGNCWISKKIRDQQGVHSNLIREGNQVAGEGNLVGHLVNSKALRVSWDGATSFFLAPLNTFNYKKKISSLDVSNGGLGVISCDEKVFVFSTQDGEIRREFTKHIAEVYCAGLFPSGLVALSAGADMQVHIWSLTDGKCPVSLKGHKQSITSTSVIERGKNIVSTSRDGAAKLWKVGESRCLATMNLEEVLNCSAVMDTRNMAELQRRLGDPVEEEDGGTQDKLLVVGGEDGGVHAVDLQSRNIINKYKCGSAVNCVAISNKNIVTGCQNGEVIVFTCPELSSPSIILHPSNSPVISILAIEGGVLVGRQDGSLTLHLFNSNTQLALSGPDNDGVTSLAKDGQYIYSASRDGAVRKYSRETLLQIAQMD